MWGVELGTGKKTPAFPEYCSILTLADVLVMEQKVGGPRLVGKSLPMSGDAIG